MHQPSSPSCAPSRHIFPLPDLACCIVRRRPDSVRGGSLCRVDVWRACTRVFLLSRIASSGILPVRFVRAQVVQDMYLVSPRAGPESREEGRGVGSCSL